MAGVVEDWTEIIGARRLAHLILAYMESLGLITEAQRLRVADVFALEVILHLKTRFKLNALHVVLWLRRDLTGRELVQQSEADTE